MERAALSRWLIAVAVVAAVAITVGVALGLVLWPD